METILGTVKHSLKLNHEQNGLFLKIHHEIERDSEREKNEFAHFDVCDTNDIIATVDLKGNVFVFNLNEKCFWQLSEVSIDDIKVIKFLSVGASEHNLLIGNKSGFIYEIEINSGRTVRCIRAFSDEINQLLCSLSNAKTVVASTTNQIKIYESDKFTKRSEFSLRSDLRIKFIKRIPHDDKLLAILHNDTICIFSFCDALKLIRHFDPLRARERFLRKSHHKIEAMSYVKDNGVDDESGGNGINGDSVRNDDDDSRIIKSVTRDYRNGVIVDVAFDSNGNNFVIACSDHTNSIMLCSTMMWDVRRVIAYPDFYIQQCQFVPYSSGSGNNSNLLLALASNGNLMLTCMGDLNSRMLIDMNNVFRFALSANGRLLMNLQRGDLLVYNLENHLNSFCKRVVRGREESTPTTTSSSTAFSSERQQRNRKGLVEIQMKMKETMPRARLLPILKEFGEYPEKYRAIMWKTLLQLPENCESFATLLRRELSPSVSNYDKRFSLVDHKALNNLKQIMSCLAHWSPLLASVRYLPKFVFPFVKLSKGDLLFNFELVATLLLNHCRMWFEHAPVLHTPYAYLNLVETALTRVDRPLYDFYKSRGITSEHYALPLMESALSEVFDDHTWQQLWDHIVSNEPSFLLFVIVALNSALRTITMRTESVEGIKQTFHEPNYVNFKKLMKRAHAYMRKCPERLSAPALSPLSPGEYVERLEQRHDQGNLINANVTELEALREEQRALDRKLAEMEGFERTMEARMQSALIDEENQRRMKEIESKFARALDEEEQRIIYQRKLLLLNTKKAREKEIEMIIQMKNAFLRSKVETGKQDLEMMLHAIEKQRVREEIEMQMAEENLKLKEIAFQMKTLNVDSGRCGDLREKYKDAADKLVEQHRKFMTELSQFESAPAVKAEEASSSSTLVSRSSESATSITTTASYDGCQPDVDMAERAFNELQEEYDYWAGKDGKSEECVRHMKRIKGDMNKLEGEINSLLMKLGGD